MKAINFKLATFTFAAMLLASCSDSNNDSTPAASMNTSIVGSEVTTSTNAQELASRVFNFKSKTATTKTRTINDTNSSYFSGVINMPDEPTVPADAYDWSKGSDNNYHKTYYVPANTTVTSLPWDENRESTIYVQGKVNIPNGYWGQKLTIIVLSGGELISSNNNLGLAALYNYGKLSYTLSADLIISYPFYQKGNLTLPEGRGINIQNKCIIDGNLKAASLNNNGMILNVKGNCDLGNSKFILNGEGSDQWYDNPNKVAMNVDGTFTAGSAEFNSAARFYSGCAVKIADYININSNSIVSVSYLKAKTIKQSSGTSFILKDQSLIECEEYDDQNAGEEATSDAQNSGSVILGDNAQAVVKADRFVFNTGGPLENGTEKYNCFMFRTPSKTSKIILDGKYYRKSGENYIEILPYFPGAQIYWAKDKDNASDVIINKTECNGQTGWEPKDPDPKPKDPIVPISVIESDHTHDISATCVQPYSNKMYMSYHTRGEGHGSCIEVFQPVDANNNVNLLQYVYDKDGYVDWNHLMVYHKGDVKQVYVVGNHYKKAGVLGYIDIANGGLLNTDPKTIVTEDGENKTIQPLNLLPLDANKPKTDENCIVYDDSSNRFIVMTTDGYVTYDPETLNEIEKVSKPGKAKHVTIGDGKVVTLVFTEQAKTKDDPTEAIKAQIEVRDRNATMASEPKLTIKVPAVMPHYGKNTIVAKNSKIYACLGAAGLYCYDANTGTELGHYQMPSPIIQDSKEGKVGAYKAYANGCYVGDDGKIYIAYGSYGVVVLKAGTLEAGAPETIAHVCEGKSANYITVYNGYIYVAYGQKRLQVYQLLDE